MADCRFQPLATLPAGRGYCPTCDPNADHPFVLGGHRRCRPRPPRVRKTAAVTEDFPPLTAEDSEFRYVICRWNLCGHYEARTTRSAAGRKPSEWCHCTKTCRGQSTPIAQLVKGHRGCPALYF